ncbi:putative pentatricopeptide repeat-containing protein At5g40405 [Amborella trichopoda]|uniref:putative pentatricopeptide repeat-containing protein At5g40405 n=1 Tax=Amborella trichopoda TaxID=13333 RepID=UPI0009C11A9F|nr:putative pentatricopeptide repeat-containing protein At5g40405 [Amborella trichopoda]|eukprot:XP_011622555.2 putative pentatricopeptide repeat-containing protein At5g40405 [Amborella trichopoda]
MAALRSISKHPILLLESCSSMAHFKQILAQTITTTIIQDAFHAGKLIAFCALSDSLNLDYARLILSLTKEPTIFSLNTMIRAYSKSSTPEEGLSLYHHMKKTGVPPDNFTFTFLVRTCTQISSIGYGKVVHGSAIKLGFELDGHVESALIHMYANFGHVESARQLFGKSPDPDIVAWTAMIGAWAKCNDLDRARECFDRMPRRDSIAWNAMITGYVHAGYSREALSLFDDMQRDGVRPNEATMVSVLSACSHLGAMDQGKWVHVYIEKHRLKLTVTLGTALIDMYAKCGNIDRAMEVFCRMQEKNVFTWSSMMGGMAMHGHGDACIELLGRMREAGVAPNEVTFVALLHGCSVNGSVEKGREFFNQMVGVYRIEPKAEHYGCMVDLYGRAGLLSEAVGVIHGMPFDPHAGAWGALLGACRLHKNLVLGEYALNKIIEIESHHDGAYVLLSNMYAASNQWDGVSGLRSLMRERGVRKEPGCSVIEVDGVVHEFFVGDRSHPNFREIEAKLGEIWGRLRLEGYMPNTTQVLFDIEEEEKEDSLSRHSEKLAIAFGFISLGPEVPIRIVKNLRVCTDCHDVTKLMSKVFGREIVVRDRNRFHHFRDGTCSCMDYW